MHSKEYTKSQALRQNIDRRIADKSSRLFHDALTHYSPSSMTFTYSVALFLFTPISATRIELPQNNADKM